MILSLYLADTNPLTDLGKVMETVGLNWPQFLSQLFVFLVVAFVLNKFGFGPVQKVLQERRQTIAEGLKNAEKIKKELASAESARIAILQKANEQATAIIAEAQRAAGLLGERRIKEAAAQAEDILRKAQEAATLERDELLTELKQSIASLVIQTTEKVAGKVLTTEDQNRLNAETALQLNAAQN